MQKKQDSDVQVVINPSDDIIDGRDLGRFPSASIQDQPSELTALLPTDENKPRQKRCHVSAEKLGRLKNISICAVSTLEATVNGAALGYALYLIPAIVESAEGQWGYALVGAFGAANGTLEILNLTEHIPKAKMKAIEMIRDSVIVSLGAVSPLGAFIHNEYVLLGSSIGSSVGLTAAQVGVKHLLAKPASQSKKPSCCVKLSTSRFALHASRIGRAAAPALVGGIKGAGSLYYSLSIFQNLELDTNPYGAGFGLAGIGIANGAAQYGYSIPAKLMRNLVDASYSGFFWLLMALDITMDASSENNTITDAELIIYCVMSVTIVSMVATKRFIRDQPPESEVELLEDEESSSESLDFEHDPLLQSDQDDSLVEDDALSVAGFSERSITSLERVACQRKVSFKSSPPTHQKR